MVSSPLETIRVILSSKSTFSNHDTGEEMDDSQYLKGGRFVPCGSN